MSTTRSIAIVSGLMLITSSFTSCMTSNVVSKAKLDRKNETVTSVYNSFIDSGNNIVINFEGRINGHKKSPYHISIPVDTLISLFGQEKTLDYYPDSTIQSTHDVSRVYRVLDYNTKQYGLGIGIELNRNALKEGYYTPAKTSYVNGSIVNYSDKKGFRYRDTSSAKSQVLNARHAVFIYYPDPEHLQQYNKVMKSNYIVFSVEPSPKRNYARYALVPLTATGDLVTGPFQAIGLGYMALLAYAMKF